MRLFPVFMPDDERCVVCGDMTSTHPEMLDPYHPVPQWAERWHRINYHTDAGTFVVCRGCADDHQQRMMSPHGGTGLPLIPGTDSPRRVIASDSTLAAENA